MGQHHQRHLCRYIKIYLSSRWSGGRAGTPDLTGALLLDRKFINVSNVCWPHPRQLFSTEPEIAYEERMVVVVPGAEEMQKRARYASKWGIGNTKKTTKLTRTWGERETGGGCKRRRVHRGHRTRCLFTACKPRKRKNTICGFLFFSFFFFFFFICTTFCSLLFYTIDKRKLWILLLLFVLCLLLCTFHLMLSLPLPVECKAHQILTR